MRKMTDIAVLLQHELLADAITFCAFEEKWDRTTAKRKHRENQVLCNWGPHKSENWLTISKTAINLCISYTEGSPYWVVPTSHVAVENFLLSHQNICTVKLDTLTFQTWCVVQFRLPMYTVLCIKMCVCVYTHTHTYTHKVLQNPGVILQIPCYKINLTWKLALFCLLMLHNNSNFCIIFKFLVEDEITY
jgi:hypothetical protein